MPPRFRNGPPSLIPSQRPTGRPAFVNSANPDIRDARRWVPPAKMPGYSEGNDQLVPVSIPRPQNNENYVISTYDSRPNNSRDFNRASTVDVLLDATARIVSFNFNVDPGRVLVIRSWALSLIFTTANPANPVTNPDGTSNVIMNITMLINDTPVPDYANLPFNTFPFGPVTGTPFIQVAPQNAFTFLAEMDPAVSADITILNGQLTIFGNSLLSTNRDANVETSTPFPIPVSEANV